MKTSSVLLILTALISLSHSLFADTCGKIDIGPAIIHIDVLESNKTIKKVNMLGVKADGSYLIWKGVCLKGGALYGRQGHSETASGNIGIGHYTPICPTFSFTPSIGCTFTQFHTHLPHPFFPATLKERFRSISPYLALEATYTIVPGWRISAFYQYAFSRTYTRISSTLLPKSLTTKSNPKGPNYSFLLEHDLNEHWSINLGGSYNISLTKEKHGIRAYGGRLAIAYWF